MAKNTDQGYRIGSVRDRSQTFNPKTEQFVKRDDSSGRFIAAKDGSYKGVAHEPDGERNSHRDDRGEAQSYVFSDLRSVAVNGLYSTSVTEPSRTLLTTSSMTDNGTKYHSLG